MTEATNLVKSITKGIQEKKGQHIVIADLSHIDGAIANYFVICQGNSPTQVEAIAESVGEICRKEAGEKPVNVNGLGNNQWVADRQDNPNIHNNSTPQKWTETAINFQGATISRRCPGSI